MTFPNIKAAVGQQDRTTIKGRVVARFPASVWGANGLSVTKVAGAYTIANDWGALQKDASVTDPTRTFVPAYLAALGDDPEAFRRISFSAFSQSVADALDLGAIADAMVDGGYGAGDMLKSVYDSDDDGVVDEAEAVDWTGITSMPAAIDAIDGLTPAADRLAYYTGESTGALTTLTSAGRALIDDADAAAQRTTLGLGSAATYATADLPVSTATQTALDAKSNKETTFNSQGGTSYTLVLADSDKIVEMYNASPKTLTVPPNSSVAFPIGTRITVLSSGGNSITITPGSGVTIWVDGSTYTLPNNCFVFMVKKDTNTWFMQGRLT